jgi:hypothetical protein
MDFDGGKKRIAAGCGQMRCHPAPFPKLPDGEDGLRKSMFPGLFGRSGAWIMMA